MGDMSPPIFRGTAVIGLPHDPGTAPQSGGTWRRLDDGNVRITCPECWVVEHCLPTSSIATDGTVTVQCACGLDKRCSLAEWHAPPLKGGLD